MFDLSIAFLNTSPLNSRGTRGVAALSGIAAVLAGCGGGGGGGGGGSSPVNNPPPANRDPVAGTAPVQDTMVNATAGEAIEAINLAEAFRDPDGDALTFTLTVERADGMTLGDFGLSVNDDGEIVGTPTVGGLLTITVTATDPGGAMYAQAFTLDTNRVPTVANAVDDVAETIGVAIEPIDLSDLFTDPDGDTLTLSVDFSRENSRLEFDEEENQITGTLTGTENVEITIMAIDGRGATVDHRFEIMATVPDFEGTPGDDVLTDNAPNWDRTIRGLGGNDTITGGAGDDAIDGGGGDDTAVYVGAIAGFTITSSAPNGDIIVEDTDANADGDEGMDTLENVERIQFGGDVFRIVEGATGADPSLEGNSGNDLILGLAGGDMISGGTGDDVIIGGVGDDTVEYEGDYKDFTFMATLGAGDAVEIEVDDTEGSGDDDEGTDTLKGIEKLRFGTDDFDIVLGKNDVDNIQGKSGNEIILGFNGGTGTGASTNERINGGLGHDIILGGNDVDFIRGDGIYSPRGNPTNDSDVIYGFGGSDTLHGDNGNDVIYGGAGDDEIFAGDHDDRISGGIGDDEIRGDKGKDTAVYAGAFADFTITGAFDNDSATITVLDDEAGNNGDEGTDTLTNVERIQFGDDLFNIVVGNDNANMALDGGTGDDLIFGFVGDDTIKGGEGDDIIDGGGNTDTAVYDGDFTDYDITGSFSGSSVTIIVEDISTSANGDEGLDTLEYVERLQFGSTLFDIVVGTDAGATINGKMGADMIFGFGGDDTLQGHGGDDVFWGGPGNDRIFEAGGVDTVVYDGNYKDFIYTHTEITTIWEFRIKDTVGVGDDDEGMDIVYVTEKIRFNNIDFDIVPGSSNVDNTQGTSGNDMILGFNGGTGNGHSESERINGGLGHDIILGGNGMDFIRGDGIVGDPNGDITNDSDVIYGFGGNDTLDGDGGNDDIYGGAGDDTIYGGEDNDIIDGGADEDTAVYAGDRDDYSIWKDGDNFIVLDKESDPDESEGRDTLSNVEKIKFGDADAVDLDDALASDTSVPPGAIRAPRKDEIAAFSVEDDVTPADVFTAVQGAPVNACVDCETRIDPMSPWTADDPCGCFW